MAQEWPLALRNRLNVDGLNFEIGETLIRSEMDTGPSKVRKRFTKAIDKFACTMLILRSEYSTFRTFYDTTLSNGSLTFNYIHPMTGTSTEFRFSGAPKLVPLGGVHFTLLMTWEIV